MLVYTYTTDIQPRAVAHEVASSAERVGDDVERAEGVRLEVVLGGPLFA